MPSLPKLKGGLCSKPTEAEVAESVLRYLQAVLTTVLSDDDVLVAFLNPPADTIVVTNPISPLKNYRLQSPPFEHQILFSQR